jgi:hypothetical protein
MKHILFSLMIISIAIFMFVGIIGLFFIWFGSGEYNVFVGVACGAIFLGFFLSKLNKKLYYPEIEPEELLNQYLRDHPDKFKKLQILFQRIEDLSKPQEITFPKGTIMQLKGTHKSILTLYEKKIVIIHSGAGSRMTGIAGEHSFMIKDIIGIEVNKGGTMGSRGHIFFNHKGLQSSPHNDSNMGFDSLQKVGSKNAVLFKSKDYSSFKLFQEKAEKLMGEVGTSSSTIVNEVSIPDEIKKLSDLKDQGILTEEEFQTKKTDLLNKM